MSKLLQIIEANLIIRLSDKETTNQEFDRLCDTAFFLENREKVSTPCETETVKPVKVSTNGVRGTFKAEEEPECPTPDVEEEEPTEPETEEEESDEEEGVKETPTQKEKREINERIVELGGTALKSGSIDKHKKVLKSIEAEQPETEDDEEDEEITLDDAYEMAREEYEKAVSERDVSADEFLKIIKDTGNDSVDEIEDVKVMLEVVEKIKQLGK